MIPLSITVQGIYFPLKRTRTSVLNLRAQELAKNAVLQWPPCSMNFKLDFAASAQSEPNKAFMGWHPRHI